MHLATHPQPFGRLISNGFEFFSPLFSKILPIIILMVVSLVIAFGVGVAGAYLVGGIAGVILAVIFFIVGFLLMAFFYAAQLIRGYGVLSSNESMIQHTWSLSKGRILPIIFGIIMLAIILMAITLVFQLLTYGLTYVIQNYYVSAIILAIGWIVSIYIMVKLILALPLIAIRNNHVAEGIGNSYKLTQGSWWRSFGLFFIVVGIPHLVFTAIMIGIQMMLVPGTLYYVISGIIGIVQYLVVTVLTISATLTLMNDLELRKAPVATSAPVL